jgi:hypothetical protein
MVGMNWIDRIPSTVISCFLVVTGNNSFRFESDSSVYLKSMFKFEGSERLFVVKL